MNEHQRATRPRAFILTGYLPVVCRDSIYIDDLRRRDLKVLVVTPAISRSYAATHGRDPAHPVSRIDEIAVVDGSVASEGSFLPGVIEHLDHLVDLGVDLLYLTPVFPAASNHRYDASRFDVIDPLLGGDEAYIALIQAAHERGIRVIGDLTSNHSGDRHEWFQAAYRHPGAATESFYYFTDAENTAYESWLGVSSLPKFDWSSDELRERFITGEDSIVARWLKPPYSIDGWRIDVATVVACKRSSAALRR